MKMKLTQIKMGNKKRTKLSGQGKSKTNRYRTKVKFSEPSVRKSNGSSEANQFEADYEKILFQENENINLEDIRLLLPIKTQSGQIQNRLIFDKKDGSHKEKHDQLLTENFSDDIPNLQKADITEPKNTLQLLKCREETIKLCRYKIGVLSSEILENPEEKLHSFLILLNFMEEKNPQACVTIRKLATASLLEIFKDLLPSYNIRLFEKNEVKLKKETLKLQNYETSILKYYKQYLQKLEKMATVLRKRRQAVNLKKQDIYLGTFAIDCLSHLLETQPHFNFSSNIAVFLVPFLDSKYKNIRECVANCFMQLFKDVKHGGLSLIILRRLNQYIKNCKHLVHVELISVLLSLRIKHINVDESKESESKNKKHILSKQRILASKRERKMKNKLKQIEKEILETKAEETKHIKNNIFTEIISLVFTIYFRILKEAPSGQILLSCLDGVSKFSEYINIDFYQDLINFLDKLLNRNNITLREQLHCIHAAFVILSKPASILNIDSTRFYVHLYKILLDVHIGKSYAEIDMIIKTLVQVLVHSRKILTQNRLLAFVKRITATALTLQHNSVLGIAYINRLVMQNCKVVSILLDTDSSVGDGIYLPELNDPENCNARCATLWEMVAMQRHYHVTVQSVAKNLAWEVPIKGEAQLSTSILKLSPTSIYEQYDPSQATFKPIIRLPTSRNIKNIQNGIFSNRVNKAIYTSQIDQLFENGHFDIFKELKKNAIKT